MGKNIVIIGNGVSGITCARHVRKLSKHRITVISSESEHFFSRTALMYVYMGHMKFEHTKPYEDFFWEKNKIDIIKKFVKQVDTKNKLLLFSDDSSINYDVLVLATGSKSNKFGWPGQDFKGVQGLYNLQDLENMEENTKGISSAVIVGGGLIGIEMAEMLRSRKIGVTFLVREKKFWGNILPLEEAEMINRHIREHHVDLRLEAELKEIKGDSTGRVSSIITNKDEEIPCQFVGLTVGVSPNVDFLKDSGIETDKGVLVNDFFETNVIDIYAIGDCAQFRVPPEGRKPIEQVWYTGRMHGETLAKTICGQQSAYSPGHWFNSAKFFDIEYQTYGVVNSKLSENEQTFYWEHSNGKISFRVVYDKNDKIIIGFNVFGFRLRHEVCDKWLTEKRTVDYVIEHLLKANFDPEFYRKYEPEIIKLYNMQSDKNLKLKSHKGLLATFLK
ncbi:MAG: NAD(P)/FAD-dependent oxidoreductase [Bacteroidetes bacterium]|nr:NAD(P)/FAD-dependent oxidoreductase [Bacteroidota bacterium]